jgi:hypothetical protein
MHFTFYISKMKLYLNCTLRANPTNNYAHTSLHIRLALNKNIFLFYVFSMLNVYSPKPSNNYTNLTQKCRIYITMYYYNILLYDVQYC